MPRERRPADVLPVSLPPRGISRVESADDVAMLVALAGLASNAA